MNGRAVAFYRAHPGTAAAATWLVIGLAAFGGAGLTVSAAIVVERALQRRAAR